MKKIITAFLLSGTATCMTTAVSAQEFETIYTPPPAASKSRIDVGKLRFGVFFAPTVSWMKPTASKSDDGIYRVQSKGSKMGYTWGLLVDYFFAENYALHTGFQVNTSGGKILATNPDVSLPSSNTVYSALFNYSVQYLELPFHFKFRTDEISTSRIKAFGQIGLTAGVNVGKRATYTVHYTDDNTLMQTATGNREKLKGGLTMAPVMVQLNIGAGAERALSDKVTAYAGLFFNNGLFPDATNPKEFDLGYKGTFGDGKIRLNNLALRLGIYF